MAGLVEQPIPNLAWFPRGESTVPPRGRASPSILCRVCCTEGTENPVPLFSKIEESLIADLVTEYTGVQISKDDGLPEHVCATCVEQLQGFIRFISKARESDCELRRRFKVESPDVDDGEILIKYEELDSDDQVSECFTDSNDSDLDSDYVHEEFAENASTKQETSEGSPEGTDDEDNLGTDSSDSDDDQEDKISETAGSESTSSTPVPDRTQSLFKMDPVEQETFEIVEIGSRSLCCGCYKLFDSIEKLQEHAQWKHASTSSKRDCSTKDHRCQYCFRRYSTEAMLKLHYKKTRLITQVFDCIKCNSRYLAGGQRRRHAHKHLNGGSEPGTSCGKPDKDRRFLELDSVEQATLQVIEIGSRSLCCSCYKLFESPEELKEHAQEKHATAKKGDSSRDHVCQHCFRCYASEAMLNNHYDKNNLITQVFDCIRCDARFIAGAARRKHAHNQCTSVLKMDPVEQETFETIEVGNRTICCSCYQLFDSLEELKWHAQTQHATLSNKDAAKELSCQFCFRRYAFEERLKLHNEKAKLITQVFDCRKCNTRYLAGSARRKHAHLHSSAQFKPRKKKSRGVPKRPELRTCCVRGCNLQFETEEALLAHSEATHQANKTHSSLSSLDQRPVECPVCYKRYTGELGLVEHLKRFNLPKLHVCPTCGLKFPSGKDLSIHEVVHEGKKFKCEVCPSSFASSDRLQAHVKRHSARDRNFTCSICGQSFLRRNSLQCHMLKHEGKLPFECDVCRKGFRVKGKLIDHMRTHTGEKPFPCRYCNMGFADSTNRMRHEMSHTGIKPHKCGHCEKTFITNRLKKEHEASHLGTKPYRCNGCPEAFRKSSELKEHAKQHESDDV